MSPVLGSPDFDSAVQKVMKDSNVSKEAATKIVGAAEAKKAKNGSNLDPAIKRTAKFTTLAECVEANIAAESDPVGYCIMKFPELKTSDLTVASAKLHVAVFEKKNRYGGIHDKKKKKKKMDQFLLLETTKNLTAKMNIIKLGMIRLKATQLYASLSPTDDALLSRLLKSLQSQDIAGQRDKLTEHLKLRQDVAFRLHDNPDSDVLKQELSQKDQQLTFMIEDMLRTDKKERGGVPDNISAFAKFTGKLLTSVNIVKKDKKENTNPEDSSVNKDMDSNKNDSKNTATPPEPDTKKEPKKKDDDKGKRTGKLRSGSLVDEFHTANGERYVSYFLLNGDVNLKGWGVTDASIPQHIGSFKNMPFVITSNKFFAKSAYGETFDHPSTEHFDKLGIRVGRDRQRAENDMMQQASFQEEFRVGNIEEVVKTGDGNWLAFIKIKPEFASMEMPPLVSPAVFQLNSSEPKDAISTWVGMHLAGLDESPAYGNVALYKGSCTGDKGACLTQLTASLRTGKGYLPPCGMKKLFNARLKIAQMKLAAMTSDLHQNIQRQNIHGVKKKKKKMAGGPGSGPQKNQKSKTMSEKRDERITKFQEKNPKLKKNMKVVSESKKFFHQRPTKERQDRNKKFLEKNSLATVD